ncbi:hypothetical protein CSC82_04820 [Rhodobacteraceae bacterium 4F10]|nr:hypothetical protein CSC82_04820 [Rhodobacteraceae bacterium 4F10]
MLDQSINQYLTTTKNTKLATVNLSDCVLDGRVIIGKCTQAARSAGQPKTAVNGFLIEAFSCDLTDLLELVARKFDVVWDEE